MTYRSFLRIAFAAIAALALLSPIGVGKADTLDDVRARGTLLVGQGIMGLKPYVWLKDDGSYTGLENEMIEYIIKKMGIPKYEYVVTEWQTLIPGLKAKRWDVIMSGLGVNQERMAVGGITFSKPYLLYVDYAVVRADSNIHSVADLKGKIVASVLGSMDSLNAHNMADAGQVAEVKDFNGWGEPFIALRNKQVDAVIIDQMTYLGQQEGMNDLRLVGEPMFYQPKPEWAEAESKADYKLGAAGIVVREEDVSLLNAINAAIDEMFADGTHERILRKYGAWDESQAHPMK